MIKDEIIQPAKNNYKGQLYVLTNGYSFSATGEMASLIKNANRGVFIGEETGGNPSQNTSGLMPILKLPNSNVRIRMSLICFKRAIDTPNTRRGVLPDYPIRNSVEEELAGEDTVMKFTKELVQKREALVGQ